MLSDTHPLLQQGVEDENEGMTFMSFEDVMSRATLEEVATIHKVLMKPGFSPLLASVFKGELWVNTASEEQQSAVNELLAGVFDQFGSIYMRRRDLAKVHACVRLSGSTNGMQIPWLFLFWFRTGFIIRKKGCGSYRWGAESGCAKWVITKLSPYLLGLKEQAMLVERVHFQMRWTPTMATQMANVQTFGTICGAFRWLGASGEVDPKGMLDEPGKPCYFVDDSGRVKFVRRMRTFNHTFQAVDVLPGDIRYFSARSDAAYAFKTDTTKVTNMVTGRQHTTCGWTFWSNRPLFAYEDSGSASDVATIITQFEELRAASFKVTEYMRDPSDAYFAGIFSSAGKVYAAEGEIGRIGVSKMSEWTCLLLSMNFGGQYHRTRYGRSTFYWELTDVEMIRAIYDRWQPFLLAHHDEFEALFERMRQASPSEDAQPGEKKKKPTDEVVAPKKKRVRLPNGVPNHVLIRMAFA